MSRQIQGTPGGLRCWSPRERTHIFPALQFVSDITRVAREPPWGASIYTRDQQPR